MCAVLFRLFGTVGLCNTLRTQKNKKVGTSSAKTFKGKPQSCLDRGVQMIAHDRPVQPAAQPRLDARLGLAVRASSSSLSSLTSVSIRSLLTTCVVKKEVPVRVESDLWSRDGSQEVESQILSPNFILFWHLKFGTRLATHLPTKGPTVPSLQLPSLLHRWSTRT